MLLVRPNLHLLAYCILFLLSFNVQAQLLADRLALVINDSDPSSEVVAAYYQSVYQIPDENLIHVRLKLDQPILSTAEFDALKVTINAQLLPNHQAVLFVWTNPFRVECQSITSAYTLGLDANLCKKTCAPSQPNPYYNAQNTALFKQQDLRLSMLLPSQDLDLATQVIDQGVLSRKGVFKSSAYYLRTSDSLRNTRAKFFPKNGLSFKGTGLTVRNIKADAIFNKDDILIYQTGAVFVDGLPTLNFLPGALADHLTSTGGDLNGSAQMNVLAWLEAGATASYGTVSEPCNHWQKFPNPAVLLKWYIQGNTAIEAYWKSVAWPSQGLFVGDPLAAPYAKH